MLNALNTHPVVESALDVEGQLAQSGPPELISDPDVFRVYFGVTHLANLAVALGDETGFDVTLLQTFEHFH